MTRNKKAKGEVRPPLAAQVGREGSFVGKGVAASPLGTHSGTSCHTTRRLKKTNDRITKKKGNRGKERGRRWGVETSSSLSLAKVLALSVAGTQMSTLLGYHWAGGCASSREQGWRGWLGLSSPFTSLTSRRRGVGYL